MTFCSNVYFFTQNTSNLVQNVHNIDLNGFQNEINILILNIEKFKRFLILTELGKLGKFT